MRLPGLIGSFWPTPAEEALLQVALLPGDRAERAWRRVRPRLDLDRMPPQPLRLMPLVWQGLAALGIDDPLLPRLRGLYRRAWATNQVQLAGLRSMLGVLSERGIETMLLKGAALLARYRLDPGIRPMSDVDVLVPRKRAREAAATLGRHGWAPIREAAEAPMARLMDRTHGLPLQGPSGQDGDLHWQVSGDLVLPGTPEASSDAMWRDAQPLEWDGRATHVLAPPDQLLHVCVHGARGHSSAHLQWVVDAALLLRSEPEIDWDAMRSRATMLQSTLVLRDALTYLERSGLAPIPGEVARALRRARPSSREALATRANGVQSLRLGVFPQTMARFLRETAGRGPARTAAALPDYLRRAWLLDSPWEIPGRATGKVLRRLRRQAPG